MILKRLLRPTVLVGLLLMLLLLCCALFADWIAPHNPLGPISLAASLQIAFATPNFLIQEQSVGIHYNHGNDVLDYLADPTPLRFVDGYAALPTAPGLGIEIDVAAVERADEIGHRWRNPVWRANDGSFREW